MEELNDLKKKMNHIEYEEIKGLKEDISTIKIDLARNSQLTETVAKSYDKMSDTMDSVKETMIVMSESMKQNNKTMEELGDKVDAMDSKFSNQIQDVKNGIEEVDNKSKVDLVADGTKSIRKNIWKIASFVLLSVIIVYVASYVL